MSPTPTLAVTPQLIDIGALLPSAENPRRHFDAAAMSEMATSIRLEGIKQPLIVRPRGPFRVKGTRKGLGAQAPQWEVFAHDGSVLYTREDLTDADEANRLADLMMRRHWEIIDGERRYRAGRKAGVAALPCLVKSIGDDDAIFERWMMILQHEDLNPIDEARGLARMLETRDERGRLRYTVAALALKLHKEADYIHARLPLTALPAMLAEAISGGVVGMRVGTLVGRVPSVALRTEIAEKVLHPELQDTPLTWPQTARLIRDRYCRELRTAPFNREDPALVTGAAACGECPHNSANQPENRDFGRLHMCTHLECFRAKTEAAWQHKAQAAAAAGQSVLTIAESEAIFPPGAAEGEMVPHSPWVELSWKPEDDLLKREVENPPSWAALIGEVKVPVVVARDQSGRIVELVDRRLCMEAAAVNDQQRGTHESAIFRESEKKLPRSPRPAAAQAAPLVSLGAPASVPSDPAGPDTLIAGSVPRLTDVQIVTEPGGDQVEIKTVRTREEKITWIHADDEMPDDETRVLVRLADGDVDTATHEGDGWIWNHGGAPVVGVVTWWAELPIGSEDGPA